MPVVVNYHRLVAIMDQYFKSHDMAWNFERFGRHRADLVRLQQIKGFVDKHQSFSSKIKIDLE